MKINVKGYMLEGTPEEMIHMIRILQPEEKKASKNDGGVAEHQRSLP